MELVISQISKPYASVTAIKKLSLGLTASLCLSIRGAAGRLFKMGMLMYGKDHVWKRSCVEEVVCGKEPPIKDILLWEFRSN